jgi:hypothetical protein
MKQYWKILILTLAILLMCGTASADGIDKSNGQLISLSTMRGSFSPAQTCDIKTQDCAALWDISHGVYLNYQPSGDYSQFVALLNSQGYPVAVTTDGVMSEDLSQYKILIISTLTTDDSAYSPDEVAKIKSFVDNGGKLLIMSENTDCPNENINPVSQAFGTTTGVSYLYPLDLLITNLATHPAFTGVSTVYFRAGGELSSTGTIAWTPDKKPAINVAEENRVVIIGDSNIFSNGNLGNYDNTKLAMNLWKNVYCPTSTPEFPSLFIPVTMIIGFVGAVLVIQRNREN